MENNMNNQYNNVLITTSNQQVIYTQTPLIANGQNINFQQPIIYPYTQQNML